jgi:hypothetical protein
VNWRNLFKKKRKDIKHIGSMAGHDFYVVFNPSELTYTRYFAYVQAVQLSGFKLLKEDLDICLDLIDKSISEGNIARIAHITDAIRGYQNLYLSNDLMKEVVNCFILIDDEPLEKFSTSHTQTKLSLYDNNLQIRFFFINFAMDLLRNLVSLPEHIQPEEYLNSKAVKLKETAFWKVLNLKNGSMHSTTK